MRPALLVTVVLRSANEKTRVKMNVPFSFANYLYICFVKRMILCQRKEMLTKHLKVQYLNLNDILSCNWIGGFYALL